MSGDCATRLETGASFPCFFSSPHIQSPTITNAVNFPFGTVLVSFSPHPCWLPHYLPDASRLLLNTLPAFLDLWNTKPRMFHAFGNPSGLWAQSGGVALGCLGQERLVRGLLTYLCPFAPPFSIPTPGMRAWV